MLPFLFSVFILFFLFSTSFISLSLPFFLLSHLFSSLLTVPSFFYLDFLFCDYFFFFFSSPFLVSFKSLYLIYHRFYFNLLLLLFYFHFYLVHSFFHPFMSFFPFIMSSFSSQVFPFWSIQQPRFDSGFIALSSLTYIFFPSRISTLRKLFIISVGFHLPFRDLAKSSPIILPIATEETKKQQKQINVECERDKKAGQSERNKIKNLKKRRKNKRKNDFSFSRLS